MLREEKNNWQKIVGSRWFLLMLLALAILVAFAYGRAYYRDYQVRQEIIILQKEVQKLEAKKIETTEILQYVKSNNFIEEKARTELNLIKPGEKMAIIHTSDSMPTNLVTANKTVIDNDPNPLKWWRFFFGDLQVE